MLLKTTIRIAEDHEAPEIQRILGEAGLLPGGLDWSQIAPSWLVSEYKGEIVGCIQFLLGYPVGHINFLAVVPKYQGHGIGLMLQKAAERILAKSGCDGLTAMTDHSHILRKLKKLNFVVFGPPVKWVIKRIARPRKEEKEADEDSQIYLH